MTIPRTSGTVSTRSQIDQPPPPSIFKVPGEVPGTCSQVVVAAVEDPDPALVALHEATVALLDRRRDHTRYRRDVNTLALARRDLEQLEQRAAAARDRIALAEASLEGRDEPPAVDWVPEAIAAIDASGWSAAPVEAASGPRTIGRSRRPVTDRLYRFLTADERARDTPTA